MNNNTINKILMEIEAGYDLMAEKFSETRKHFWHELKFIGDYARNGDNVLDFGCGNGRLLELIGSKNINYIGIDISQKLIEIAKKNYPSCNFQKIPSSQKLPYPNNYFNIVYSIAVFHHLPSAKLRSEMAREIYRVAKPGGHIIITAWNLWRWPYIKNIFCNYFHKLVGKSGLDWNDCYIAFKNNTRQVFNRYHHAFARGELEKLFLKAGFKTQRCDIINSKNIILIAKKQ